MKYLINQFSNKYSESKEFLGYNFKRSSVLAHRLKVDIARRVSEESKEGILKYAMAHSVNIVQLCILLIFESLSTTKNKSIELQSTKKKDMLKL